MMPLYPIHAKLYSKNVSAKPQCGTTPPEPELATKWEWIDDKTVDFTLRQGVRFQDRPPVNGRELVAEDVVYSATRQWPRVTGGSSPFLATFLASAKAVDKYKVRFQLKTPFGGWPEWQAHTYSNAVVAQESYGPDDAITTPEAHAGLGPFMFERFIRGVLLELRKNPNYWREGIPYIDGIVIRIIPDLSTQISALRSGKLDFIFERYPASLVDEVEGTAPHLQVYLCPMEVPTALHIRNDVKPFDDVRVRRAISMAIDRDALIKTVYGGRATPLYTMVTPGHSEYYMRKEDFPPEARKYLEYNPAEARRLLAEAGYPDGFATTIWATTRFPDMLKAAEAATSFLGEVGIKASLVIKEYTALTEIMRVPTQYPALVSYWAGSGETVHFAMSDKYYSTSPGNYGYVQDETVDKLIDQFMVTRDPQQTKEQARQLQIRQVMMAHNIPWPSANEVAFAQPYIKNLNFKPIPKNWSDYIKFVWLDK